MGEQNINAALEHHRTLLSAVETLQGQVQALGEERNLLAQHKVMLEADVQSLRQIAATLDNRVARLKAAPDETEIETAFTRYVQETQGGAALADGHWRGLLQAVWQAALRWDQERRRII